MTNSIVIAVLLGILVAQPSAAVDNLLSPENMPKLYRAECGSCHALYPPSLLSYGGLFSGTTGWKEIMDDLRNHFGDNAVLDLATFQQIRQYLADNAADDERRFGSRTDPPRLTTTLWFRRTHGGVKNYFEYTRIGGAANCTACHPLAERWNYEKKGIRLPKISGR